MVGDLLQAIGVALAGALIWAFHGRTDVYVVDPLCTLLFAVLVMYTTRALAADVYRMLMQGTPTNINLLQIRHTILSKPGVQDVHDLHVWDVLPGEVLLMAHVRTWAGMDQEAVLMSIEQHVRELGITHSTI